jgi:hypothetical protein
MRGGQQRGRDRQAERFGSPEVDDELILGRRLYRQIGRFGAAQDTIDISSRLRPLLELIETIGNQPAVNGFRGCEWSRPAGRPGGITGSSMPRRRPCRTKGT